MSKTDDFLKEAFAGESQANRKYQAFAAKADKEGYTQVAKLFRAASEAEAVHANNHLRVMKGVLSTPENLKAAISGEDHEYELSLIHISEPTRRTPISYAVFCLKKKKKKNKIKQKKKI